MCGNGGGSRPSTCRHRRDLRPRDQQPRPGHRADRRPDRTRRFLWDRGRVTTFDAPGATITFAAELDDRGQVVGFSTSDLTGTSFSGFLRDARGRFTAINRPGAAATLVFEINNRGQIVGVAVYPQDLPSPQPTGTPPMGRMA